MHLVVLVPVDPGRWGSLHLAVERLWLLLAAPMCLGLRRVRVRRVPHGSQGWVPRPNAVAASWDATPRVEELLLARIPPPRVDDGRSVGRCGRRGRLVPGWRRRVVPQACIGGRRARGVFLCQRRRVRLLHLVVRVRLRTCHRLLLLLGRGHGRSGD